MGYASARQAKETSWEALTVLFWGATTMTGGPAGKRTGRGVLSPEAPVQSGIHKGLEELKQP